MNTKRNALFERLVKTKLVHDYEQSFFQATGLVVSLVPATLISGWFQVRDHEHPFCRSLSKSIKGTTECQKCEEHLVKVVNGKSSPQAINCFAGLSVVAVPVMVSGLHVANLVSRQPLSRKPTAHKKKALENTLKAWGICSELPQIKKDLYRKTAITSKSIHGVTDLLTLIAQHVGEYAERSLLLPEEHEPKIVKHAKAFIQAHLNEELSLAAIARGAKVSPYHLCRVFHSKTGSTLKEYISTLRIEKAKKLLANSSFRIVEVAFDAGFGSIPRFNAVFRKITGMSPTRYRAALTSHNSSETPSCQLCPPLLSASNGMHSQHHRNNQSLNSNLPLDNFRWKL